MLHGKLTIVLPLPFRRGEGRVAGSHSAVHPGVCSSNPRESSPGSCLKNSPAAVSHYCAALGLLLLLVAQQSCWAAEPWERALARMPLVSPVTQLDSSNCVEIMLHSFQSNEVVKALIFMPGATDELYLLRRVRARLRAPAPTLLDAIAALQSQTAIQPSFRPPLLLLHLAGERLEPVIRVEQPRIAELLRTTPFVPHALYTDCDWDFIQPILKHWLKLDVRPWRSSSSSWHFYRPVLAAWNLNGWQALEAVALATQTRCTIRRHWNLLLPEKQVVFANPNFRVN